MPPVPDRGPLLPSGRPGAAGRARGFPRPAASPRVARGRRLRASAQAARPGRARGRLRSALSVGAPQEPGALRGRPLLWRSPGPPLSPVSRGGSAARRRRAPTRRKRCSAKRKVIPSKTRAAVCKRRLSQLRGVLECGGSGVVPWCGAVGAARVPTQDGAERLFPEHAAPVSRC